jgi:hypothetical protein
MNANRQLSWFVPATGYLDSFNGSVNSYSVGLDTSGYFDVFVVTGDPSGNVGYLQEYDAAQGGWQPVIGSGSLLSPLATVSATSGGQCFVSSVLNDPHAPPAGIVCGNLTLISRPQAYSRRWPVTP